MVNKLLARNGYLQNWQISNLLPTNYTAPTHLYCCPCPSTLSPLPIHIISRALFLFLLFFFLCFSPLFLLKSLPVYLSVCVCQSVCLCLSICLSVSVYQSVCPSIAPVLKSRRWRGWACFFLPSFIPFSFFFH